MIMSHLPPPPYSETPVNPDRRPLPEGWIQQYDSRHEEWFYVNTRAEPPVSQWTHPLGSASSSSAQYAPPPGPPSANNFYPSDTKSSTSRSSEYPPMPGSYGPVYDPYPYAAHGSSSHTGNGGFLGNILDSRGQVRQSRFERKMERKMARHHRKKGRIGLKGLIVAGGAALLGGLLLEEAL